MGLIGAGMWGETHARTYSEHPQAKFVAVADVNEERAKGLAKKYGAQSYYKDYRDMLRNPEVEAVAVVVPDYLHRQPAVDAAMAGKHLLVEKPLATTVEDAEAIVRAAKDAGVKLMVDFHNRWDPPFAAAKDAIEKGELGAPLLLYMRHSNAIKVPTEMLTWLPKSSSIVFWLGSHSVDLVRWLVADEVEQVYSVSRSKVLASKGFNSDDFFASILEFRRGAVATVENAWMLPNTLPVLGDFIAEIVGEKGSIRITIVGNNCIDKATETSYTQPDVLIFPTVHGKSKGFAGESIVHFIECIAGNRQPMATGEDGLAVTKILCAIRESARTKRTVRIE